jgi:hypothetical protein
MSSRLAIHAKQERPDVTGECRVIIAGAAPFDAGTEILQRSIEMVKQTSNQKALGRRLQRSQSQCKLH